jgi:hypothetical protein
MRDFKMTTPTMFTRLRKFVPMFATRVAPIYKMLNWSWSLDRARSPQIPTSKDIERQAVTLIDLMEDDPDISGTSAGGLWVRSDEDGLHLSFETSVSVFHGEESEDDDGSLT